MCALGVSLFYSDLPGSIPAGTSRKRGATDCNSVVNAALCVWAATANAGIYSVTLPHRGFDSATEAGAGSRQKMSAAIPGPRSHGRVGSLQREKTNRGGSPVKVTRPAARVERELVWPTCPWRLGVSLT